MNSKTTLQEKAEILNSLHHREEMLILPNVWDPVGAILLVDMGYPATATSSSAIALTNGYLDGENIPFEQMLLKLKQITRSVDIPVSADIEKGFAESDIQLSENIHALIEAGIVGINFEDSEKHRDGLVPLDIQCRRIQLIRETAAKENVPFFINARIDTYVHNGSLSHKEKPIETIRRGKAYKEAGADCIFPILIRDEEHIQKIAAESELPVNIMTFPGIPELQTLKDFGVKRISLGSGWLTYSAKAMKELALRLKNLEGLKDIVENEVNTGHLAKLLKK